MTSWACECEVVEQGWLASREGSLGGCYVKMVYTTSGCQNSWRKAAFQCTITYGTFVKRRATPFQIIPQIKKYLKKNKMAVRL
jgi:hypothetical protein